MAQKIVNYSWKIVSVRQPVMFHRTLDEVWLLNPNRRYILNADQVEKIEEFVESCSDLVGSSKYRPLQAGASITGGSVLVERVRDRGIGDLLFLTGPLAYLNHVTGRNIKIHVYALSDRGQVLAHNEDLHQGGVLTGPLEYDHLDHYEAHWFVETVTEHDQEPDQLNVYDALFSQLGLKPQSVDSSWKKPKTTCTSQDYSHLDQVYRMIWLQKKLDLRRTPYYVVAPFAASTLRTLDYGRWLTIIQALSQRRPVVVVGTTKMRLPEVGGMSAGEFLQRLPSLGAGVINCIDGLPLRVMTALLSRAKAHVSLDSGTLYLAQSQGTPAVSLWGTHHPGTRLQYSPEYMDLAIWKQPNCTNAPCFAYAGFPAHLCPDGRRQSACSVLAAVTPEDVLEKIDHVEAR